MTNPSTDQNDTTLRTGQDEALEGSDLERATHSPHRRLDLALSLYRSYVMRLSKSSNADQYRVTLVSVNNPDDQLNFATIEEFHQFLLNLTAD